MNSADRVIRVFDIDAIMASIEEDEPEALQRLQDLVNRCVCACGWIAIPVFTPLPRQNSVEEVYFLRGWRIYSGRYCSDHAI